MKRQVYCFVLFWVLFFSLILNSYSQELSVDQIINNANLASYYAQNDGSADVKMTIMDSQNRKRVREFRILRFDVEDGGQQKFYVYFKKPSDVAKMVFMVWKKIETDDDRWLYLPALDLVRRIAASDKRSSFVGSNFVYEDVSGRSVESDIHELISNDGNFYLINNRPKDSKGLRFSHYKVWISKKNFLPVKAEYYNHENKVIRIVESLDIKEISGIPTVVKSSAKDLESGGETIMEFFNVSYNINLEENIFTERYLRRPPVKWVR